MGNYSAAIAQTKLRASGCKTVFTPTTATLIAFARVGGGKAVEVTFVDLNRFNQVRLGKLAGIDLLRLCDSAYLCKLHDVFLGMLLRMTQAIYGYVPVQCCVTDVEHIFVDPAIRVLFCDELHQMKCLLPG